MAWFPGVNATDEDDEYRGTSGNDGRQDAPIRGLGGNDILYGFGGNDVLAGDAGNDLLFGGSGNDILDGGDGNDRIIDQDGNDNLFGGAGDDVITDYDNTIQGFDDSPFIDGGTGNDLIRLEWEMRGGDLNTLIDGGDGVDTLDFLNAEFDEITAGILTIRNIETVYARNFEIAFTADQLRSFQTIRHSETDTSTRISLIVYEDGDIDLSAALGSQPVSIDNFDSDGKLIRTGAGDDEIFGGEGAERFYGGAGNDTINGSGGASDELYGENGDDELSGTFGSFLYGGAGDDALTSSYAQYGGGGNDTLHAGVSAVGATYDGGENVDTLVVSTPNLNNDFDLRDDTLRLIERLSFGVPAASPTTVATARIFAAQIGAGLSPNASIEGYADATLDITMGGVTATDLSGFTSGGGHPRITVNGDGDAETITGSIFRDTINGAGGADVLAGGRGVDALYGGDGDDVLGSSGFDGLATGEVYDGGAGSNTLIASGFSYLVDFSNDTIANIGTLRFTNPGAFGSGTIRMTANQIEGIKNIVGQSAAQTGDVLQIAMGDRTVLYLTAQFGYVFTAFTGAGDFIVVTGDDSAETIITGGQKDVLNGGDGDDYLDGGAGFDRVFGGAGDDSLGLNTGDVVAGETFDGGAGFDSLTVMSPSIASYDLDLGRTIVTSIERIFFSSLGGSGGQGVIRLLASQVGPGVSATATIFGSNSDGTDILAFTLGGAVSLDLSGMTIDLGAGRGDYVSITGDDDAETIIGSTAVDAISGGGGDDILDGWLGADTLAGGAGDDIYLIDASDTVVELAGEGNDTIRAGFTYTLDAELEALTLTGAAAIDGTGNALNNVLMGNAGANVLRGLGGDDSYVVGARDQVIEDAGAGVDLVRTNVRWRLGDNIEQLALTGAADIVGIGNALANRVTGNVGNNQLDGRDGDDILFGKAGDDVLIGGTGRDRLTGDTGRDGFVFTAAPGRGNADVITDFTPGEDRIHLATAIFAAVGATLNTSEFRIGTTAANTIARDANDVILYNRTSGQLYYDADGNGVGAPMLIATLSSQPVLTSADFLIV